MAPFRLSNTMSFCFLIAPQSPGDNVFVLGLTTHLVQQCVSYLPRLHCFTFGLFSSSRLRLRSTASLRDTHHRRFTLSLKQESKPLTFNTKTDDGMASPAVSQAGAGARMASKQANPCNTPLSSAEELLIGPSRAHFAKTYHEVKPLAAGSNGETFLAIPRKAADEICGKVGDYACQADLFDALRKEVVVAKFPRRGRANDDLADEINFLADVLPAEDDEDTDSSSRLPISQLLDYNKDPGKLWLTLPFAQGGDLHDFYRHNPECLSLGLRWHIALQLVESLAYLHYGITDLSSTMSDDAACWPLVCHGDFHTGNVLLVPESSYRDYPNLILADFGRAKTYTPPKTNDPGPPSQSLAAFTQSQVTDFRSAAIIMTGLTLAFHHKKPLCARNFHCQSLCGQCPRADCEECGFIGRRHGKLEGLGAAEKVFVDAAADLRNFTGGREEGVKALQAFAGIARGERDLHYQLLDQEARARLDVVAVSDEEIDQALELGVVGGE